MLSAAKHLLDLTENKKQILRFAQDDWPLGIFSRACQTKRGGILTAAGNRVSKALLRARQSNSNEIGEG